MSSQISRVGPSGEVVWASTLTELAGPLHIAETELKLVALEPRTDATWLLIRASKIDRHQQADYYEVEHRLVRRDVNTGTAAESHAVKPNP